VKVKVKAAGAGDLPGSREMMPAPLRKEKGKKKKRKKKKEGVGSFNQLTSPLLKVFFFLFLSLFTVWWRRRRRRRRGRGVALLQRLNQ